VSIQPISGSGGAPPTPKAYKPKVAKDSLDSVQYVKVLDLLGEGEIEGFPTDHPLKSIYFDGTPIMRASADPDNLKDEDYNFKDIEYSIRYGTSNQQYVNGFAAVERENSVGYKFTEDSDQYTITITDVNVDAIRIINTWERLEKYQDNGDIVNWSAYWEVDVSYNGGPYHTVYSDDFYGRSPNPFQRAKTITLDGDFPISVRVKPGKLDPDNAKIQNSFTWSSYTEIVRAKLNYPYRAVAGFEAPATSITSVPTRSYRVRGIKILIPSNATVNQDDGSLAYSGIWDGTFQSAKWTTDPAWILYDLLMSKRYGLGDHLVYGPPDKWSLYAASVRANGRVLTGVGSETEPRFSCHAYISTLYEAFELAGRLASLCGMMIYWSAGGTAFAQDRPTDVSIILNQAKVKDGDFTYSTSSKSQRHTVAAVSWMDRERQELVYEYVEDRESIARYGVQKIDLDGFGICSRSQARRLGLMTLATERYQSEVVSFVVSIDVGCQIRPQAVIAIEDPVRSSGARRGGTIIGGSLRTVMIDCPVSDLPSVTTPTVLVSMVNGAVASRQVVGQDGVSLMLDSDLPSMPLVNGCYIYNDIFSKWRVLTVEEVSESEYQVTAINYFEEKYDYVERYIPLGDYRIYTKVQHITKVGLLDITASLPEISSDYSENLNTVVGRLNVSCELPDAESVYSEEFSTKVGSFQASISAETVQSAYSQQKFTAVGTLESTVDFETLVSG